MIAHKVEEMLSFNISYAENVETSNFIYSASFLEYVIS